MNKSLFSKQLELTSILEEDVINATDEEIKKAIEEKKLLDLPLKEGYKRSVFKMKRLNYQEIQDYTTKAKELSASLEPGEKPDETKLLFELFNQCFISIKLEQAGKQITLKKEDLVQDSESTVFDALTEVFGMAVLFHIANQIISESFIKQKKSILNLLDG